MKYFFVFLVTLIYTAGWSQPKLDNKKSFQKFYKQKYDKRLLILGENHGSSVSPLIYPVLVKELNKKSRVNSLLIEFGPSEAFFYSKYLKTGNEKHLNYTLYAGAIEEWREAWRSLYRYNKTLKQPLKIIGVDFDRTRTMGYALFSMMMTYDKRPHFIDSLLGEIKTDEFYKNYTIGYPTPKDVKWKEGVQQLLRDSSAILKKFLDPEDWYWVKQISENQAIKYDKIREKQMAGNIIRSINQSDDSNFFMLIGRNHAYMEPIYGTDEKVAKILLDSSEIYIKTGAILYQNGEFQPKGAHKPVILKEIENKIPWKRYFNELDKKAKKDYTIIDLKGDLCPLSRYLDYIFVARNSQPYHLLHSTKSQ